MTVNIIEEIIDKLIGPIRPTGEHNIDEHRLNNLNRYGELCQRLVKKIDDIAWKYESSPEKSIKTIVDKSNEILDNLGIKP